MMRRKSIKFGFKILTHLFGSEGKEEMMMFRRSLEGEQFENAITKTLKSETREPSIQRENRYGGRAREKEEGRKVKETMKIPLEE